MKTFKQFLSESQIGELTFSDVVALIRKHRVPSVPIHCPDAPLWRGIKVTGLERSDYLHFPPIQNRSPRDSSKIFNYLVNARLEELTSIKDARSKMYFASSQGYRRTAGDYGLLRLCVPLGETIVIYHEMKDDLWAHFTEELEEAGYRAAQLLPLEFRKFDTYLSASLTVNIAWSRQGRSCLAGINDEVLNTLLAELETEDFFGDATTQKEVAEHKDIRAIVELYANEVLELVTEKAMSEEYTVSSTITDAAELMLISDAGHLTVSNDELIPHFVNANPQLKSVSSASLTALAYDWLIAGAKGYKS